MGWVKKVLSFSIGDFLELLSNTGRRKRRVTAVGKGKLYIEAVRKSGKSLTEIHQILEHIPENQQTRLLEQITEGMIIPDSWLKAAKRTPTISSTEALNRVTREHMEALAQKIDDEVLAPIQTQTSLTKKHFQEALEKVKKVKRRHKPKSAAGAVTVTPGKGDGKERARTADLHNHMPEITEALEWPVTTGQAKKTIKGKQTLTGIDIDIAFTQNEVCFVAGKQPTMEDAQTQHDQLQGQVAQSAIIQHYAEVAERALVRSGVEDINIVSIPVAPNSSKEIREKIIEAYRNGCLTEEAATELVKDLEEEFIELPKTKPKEETILDEDAIELDDTEMI